MDTTPDRIATPAKAPTVVQARVAVAGEFLVLGALAGVWAAHIPVVQDRLHLDPATIGLVLLCMASGAVFTMPLTGALLSRFGSRLPTAILGIVYPVIGAITILSPTLPFLFVSAVFMGAGMGGLDVAMNTQAAEVEVARGKPTMSSFHGFFSLGALGGAAGAGGLISLGYSHGLGAAMIAAVLFAVSVAAAFFLWHGQPSTEGGPRFRLPPRAIIGVGVICFLGFACEGSVADWSALFMAQVKGASLALAASGYVAFSITMVFARLFGDSIVARLGGIWTTLGGGALAALGLTIAVIAPDGIVAAIGFALVGLGTANVVPVAFSAAARTPGLPAGEGVAAVTTLGYSGFLVFPPILGFIANAFGLSAALLVGAAMGVCIALLAGTVRR